MACKRIKIEVSGSPCRLTKTYTYECTYASTGLMDAEMLFLAAFNRVNAAAFCPTVCPTLRSQDFNENCSLINSLAVPGKATFTCTAVETVVCVPRSGGDVPFDDEEGGAGEDQQEDEEDDGGGGGITSTANFDTEIPCPGLPVTITVRSCFTAKKDKLTDDDKNALQLAALAFFQANVLGEGEGFTWPILACENDCALECSAWPAFGEPKKNDEGSWCIDASWSCWCLEPKEEKYAFAPAGTNTLVMTSLGAWRPAWALGRDSVRAFYRDRAAAPPLAEFGLAAVVTDDAAWERGSSRNLPDGLIHGVEE